MDDKPDTLMTPKRLKQRRPFIRYIDKNGKLVTVLPPAFAEGAEGTQSVLPKDHIEFD